MISKRFEKRKHAQSDAFRKPLKGSMWIEVRFHVNCKKVCTWLTYTKLHANYVQTMCTRSMKLLCKLCVNFIQVFLVGANIIVQTSCKLKMNLARPTLKFWGRYYFNASHTSQTLNPARFTDKITAFESWLAWCTNHLQTKYSPVQTKISHM